MGQFFFTPLEVIYPYLSTVTHVLWVLAWLLSRSVIKCWESGGFLADFSQRWQGIRQGIRQRMRQVIRQGMRQARRTRALLCTLMLWVNGKVSFSRSEIYFISSCEWIISARPSCLVNFWVCSVKKSYERKFFTMVKRKWCIIFSWDDWQLTDIGRTSATAKTREVDWKRVWNKFRCFSSVICPLLPSDNIATSSLLSTSQHLDSFSDNTSSTLTADSQVKGNSRSWLWEWD